MKGNNELVLNESTVIEAMQEYLDKRMGIFAPKVVSVAATNNDRYCKSFSIKTDDKPIPEPTGVAPASAVMLAQG